MPAMDKDIHAAYRAATSTLRKRHLAEFYELLGAEYSARGMTVTRRLRGEAKRQRDLEAAKRLVEELSTPE